MKRKTSFSLEADTLQWLTKTAREAGLNRSSLIEVIVRQYKAAEAAEAAEDERKKRWGDQEKTPGPRRRWDDQTGEKQSAPTALNVLPYKVKHR